ncbi:MAG: hypothetical protein Q4C59_07810, partial [Lachnospiraceae bacterium]|nr:hypothetical protein [Lachnospiraceae bacterium]
MMKRGKKTVGKQCLSRRILAVLLAVCMLFTSSGFQVISAESGTEASSEQKAAGESEAARIAAEKKAAEESEAARIAAEKKA